MQDHFDQLITYTQITHKFHKYNIPQFVGCSEASYDMNSWNTKSLQYMDKIPVVIITRHPFSRIEHTMRGALYSLNYTLEDFQKKSVSTLRTEAIKFMIPKATPILKNLSNYNIQDYPYYEWVLDYLFLRKTLQNFKPFPIFTFEYLFYNPVQFKILLEYITQGQILFTDKMKQIMKKYGKQAFSHHDRPYHIYFGKGKIFETENYTNKEVTQHPLYKIADDIIHKYTYVRLSPHEIWNNWELELKEWFLALDKQYNLVELYEQFNLDLHFIRK